MTSFSALQTMGGVQPAASPMAPNAGYAVASNAAAAPSPGQTVTAKADSTAGLAPAYFFALLVALMVTARVVIEKTGAEVD